MEQKFIADFIASDLPALLLAALVIYLILWNKVLNNRIDVKTRHLKAQMEQNQILYQTLLDRERLKQDYFLSLSHELRTPLHVILSALQLQQQDAASSIEEQEIRNKRICSLIKDNSYRLLRVINNLIDINKLDSNVFVLKPSNVDLGQETRKIFEAVKPWFKKKAVRLSIEEMDSSLITTCDKENFIRVVLNLLSNALKFTPAGGDVLITTARNRISGDLVVSVKDSGIGIPETEHQRIFEKYLQLDRELVRNTEGNGLGLAIVKGLVELECGTVQVISSPRKGTEFRINYPAKKAASQDADSGLVHRETLDYGVRMEFSELLQD